MKRFVSNSQYFKGTPIFSNAHRLCSTKNWDNSKSPTAKELKQLANEKVNDIKPSVGISIAVSNPDRGVFTHTFGSANVTNDYPITSDTKMAIASNTKPIVVAITLKLIDEMPRHFPKGLNTTLDEIRDNEQKQIFTADATLLTKTDEKVDLNKPTYCSTPEQGFFNKDRKYHKPTLNRISLHKLLLETSGLADVFSGVNLSNTPYISDFCHDVFNKILNPNERLSAKKPLEALQVLKKFGLLKQAEPEPEKPMQSHNTDMFLLSIIIERVSGKTLNALLLEKILQPLNIDPEAMSFVTKKVKMTDKTIARPYAFLSTPSEVEAAISSKTLCKQIDEKMAKQLSSVHLSKLGHDIQTLRYIEKGSKKTRALIDVLAISEEGLDNIVGASGIFATPKAYIRFYHALITGKLLSKSQQKSFDNSFKTAATDKKEAVETKIGYGSNIYQASSQQECKTATTTHTGFIIGSTSMVVYDHGTDTTIMIATNATGHWNEMPCLLVSKEPHFDSAKMTELTSRYLSTFRK